MSNFITPFKNAFWKSKLDYKNKDYFAEFIINEYKKSPSMTPNGWNCDVHSSFKKFPNKTNDYKIEQCKIPQELILLIEKKCNEFLDEIEIDLKEDFYIQSCWYNAYTNNQYQEIHNHSIGNLFSGIYYLKYDESYHSKTEFLNNYYNLNYFDDTILDEIGKNKLFCSSIEIEENDILIFPSNVWHRVKPSNSNQIRITVSFNISCTNIVNNNPIITSS